MSDPRILSRDEYERRVMASIFGTPSDKVRPLLDHDAAMRAALDATPEASEPTKDARDVLADRMAKWLGDDAGVYRFADDLWRDLNDAGYDIVPEVVVERLNAANARLSAALDATEPAETYECVPMGWRNTETGELRATWMPAKPAGPWEELFVRRPVPSATPAAEPTDAELIVALREAAVRDGVACPTCGGTDPTVRNLVDGLIPPEMMGAIVIPKHGRCTDPWHGGGTADKENNER